MLSNTMSFEPRVLVVDDNEAMLGCVATVLTPECVIVGAAKDGRAALRVAASVHPDVIVLDISMPGMTGLEVAASLRAAGSEAAVVFLTVHSDEDIVLAAQAREAPALS